MTEALHTDKLRIREIILYRFNILLWARIIWKKKLKSNWEKDFRFTIENKKWLDYSTRIAVRISALIENKKDFNQVALANSLKISPQQISKILKGKENLTLKTIANISEALNEELIAFPPYKDTDIRLMPIDFIGSFKYDYLTFYRQ